MTSVLNKIEFWAKDDLRRKITGIGLQPTGAPKMSYIQPVWSSSGEDTLRATPLNWSKAQANGAVVCLELDNSTTLDEFCMGGEVSTCWCAREAWRCRWVGWRLPKRVFAT